MGCTAICLVHERSHEFAGLAKDGEPLRGFIAGIIAYSGLIAVVVLMKLIAYWVERPPKASPGHAETSVIESKAADGPARPRAW